MPVFILWFHMFKYLSPPGVRFPLSLFMYILMMKAYDGLEHVIVGASLAVLYISGLSLAGSVPCWGNTS